MDTKRGRTFCKYFLTHHANERKIERDIKDYEIKNALIRCNKIDSIINERDAIIYKDPKNHLTIVLNPYDKAIITLWKKNTNDVIVNTKINNLKSLVIMNDKTINMKRINTRDKTKGYSNNTKNVEDYILTEYSKILMRRNRIKEKKIIKALKKWKKEEDYIKNIPNIVRYKNNCITLILNPYDGIILSVNKEEVIINKKYRKEKITKPNKKRVKR